MPVDAARSVATRAECRQPAEPGPPTGRVARRGPRRGAEDDEAPELDHTVVEPEDAVRPEEVLREPEEAPDFDRGAVDRLLDDPADCPERVEAPER